MEYSRRQEKVLSTITPSDIKDYVHSEVYTDNNISIFVFETDEINVIDGCVFYNPIAGKYEIFVNEHAEFLSTLDHEMAHVANGDV